MRKKILTLLMLLLCSLGSFYACGNPYEGMKIEIVEIDADYNSTGFVTLNLSTAEIKTIVIRVLAKDNVSKEVYVNAAGAGISTSVSFKNNLNYIKITPHFSGETKITVLTKEGNISKVIYVNVVEGIQGIVINRNAIDENGGIIDFSSVLDNALTFKPKSTSEKEILLSYDDDYIISQGGGFGTQLTNAYRAWLADYFTIDGSKLIAKKGAKNHENAMIDPNGKVVVPIKITSKHDSSIFDTKAIEVLDIVQRVSIYMKSDTDGSPIKLEPSTDGVYEIVLANFNTIGDELTPNEQDSYNYLYERFISIRAGEDIHDPVYKDEDYKIEFNNNDSDSVIRKGEINDTSVTINGPQYIASIISSSDVEGILPYDSTFSQYENLTHFKLSSYKANISKSGNIIFTVDHKDYPGLFTKKITVKLNVKSFPRIIEINNEINPDPINVFDEYFGMTGTKVKVDALPFYNGFFDAEIVAQNPLDTEKVSILQRKSGQVVPFERGVNGDTIYLKHNFINIPNDTLKLRVTFVFSVTPLGAIEGFKDYVVSKEYDLNLLPSLTREKLEDSIVCNQFNINIGYPEQVITEGQEPLLILDLSRISEDYKNYSVYDYFDIDTLKNQLSSEVDLKVKDNEPYKLYIAVNDNKEVGFGSFDIISRNSAGSEKIGETIQYQVFVPMMFNSEIEMPFAMELNKNSPNILLYGAPDTTLANAGNISFKNPIFDNKVWSDSKYSTTYSLVLKTNSIIDINFFNYLLYQDNNQELIKKYAIIPEVINNDYSMISWENGKLTTKNNTTADKNIPAKLQFSYAGWVWNNVSKKYEYSSYTQSLNIWVYETVESFQITSSKDKTIYDLASVGSLNADASKYQLSYEILPGIEKLGGLSSTLFKGISYDVEFNSGKGLVGFDDLLLKTIYVSEYGNLDIYLKDIATWENQMLSFRDFYELIGYSINDSGNDSDFYKLATAWMTCYGLTTMTLNDINSMLENWIFASKIINIDIVVTVSQFGRVVTSDSAKITINRADKIEKIIVTGVPETGLYFEKRNDNIIFNIQNVNLDIFPINPFNKNIRLRNFNNSVFQVLDSEGNDLDSSGLITSTSFKIKAKGVGTAYLTIAAEDSFYDDDDLVASTKIVLRIKVADGTALYPFEIKNENDFMSMLTDISSKDYFHYVLTNNISLDSMNWLQAQPLLSGANEFNLSGEFKYSYNGQEYISYNSIIFNWDIKENDISDIIKNNNEKFVYDKSLNIGLFPTIESTAASIDNVAINARININLPKIVSGIAGENEISVSDILNIDTFNFGVIAGELFGNVKNCNIQGIVNINTANWDSSEFNKTINIGGFVGRMSKSIDNSTIVHSSITGDSIKNTLDNTVNVDIAMNITSLFDSTTRTSSYQYYVSNLNVGGLVGYADLRNIIKDLSVAASIVVLDEDGNYSRGNIGGVVGAALDPYIEKVVSYPILRALENVGGIIGYINRTFAYQSEIKDCIVYLVEGYNKTGEDRTSIIGQNNVGGMVGLVVGYDHSTDARSYLTTQFGELYLDIIIQHSYVRAFSSANMDGENYFGNIYLKYHDSISTSQYAGGLVGSVAGNILITNSYFDGDIYYDTECDFISSFVGKLSVVNGTRNNMSNEEIRAFIVNSYAIANILSKNAGEQNEENNGNVNSKFIYNLFSGEETSVVQSVNEGVVSYKIAGKKDGANYKDINTITANSYVLINNDIKFIYKVIDDMDFKELSFIANYLQANDKLIQIYGLKGNDKSQFYVSSSKDMNINLQEIFKKISSQYDIKGGGNPNTVQGSSMTSNLKNIMENFTNYIVKEIKVRKS